MGRHQYDALGRPTTTSQQLIDATYYNKTEYDGWGRPSRLTYTRGSNAAAAKVFDQRYNANGFLARVERNAQVLLQIAGQDAAHRVTAAGLGNRLAQVREYNAYTGRLANGELDTAAGDPRFHEGYFYDSIGNVNSRTQRWDSGDFTETFTYDGLNRLDSSTLLGEVKRYTYDVGGNILTKTGVGSGTGKYNYPAVGKARPNAVSSIDGLGSFTYDANGNQLTTPYSSPSWTSFDMPFSLTKGAVTEKFYYGPEHQRTRQDRGADRVVYAGAQEVETKGGQLIIKTYWHMGIGVEIEQGGVTKLFWNHADRLGSIVATTKEDGTLESRQTFDPWGKRRVYNGTATPNTLDGSPDNRGFTGHEMLDELDLVHMNGRVYDPFVGRFLSGDPLIQDPYSGQNYSRYTYVLNNPTNLTDPTGFACAVPETGTRIPPCNNSDDDKVLVRSDGSKEVVLGNGKGKTLESIGLRNNGGFVGVNPKLGGAATVGGSDSSASSGVNGAPPGQATGRPSNGPGSTNHLEQLPSYVADDLGRAKIRIRYVHDNVTEAAPELAGEVIPGHDQKADKLPGLFYTRKTPHTVIIATSEEAWGRTPSKNLGYHEIGHGFDQAAGNLSARTDFRQAWGNDNSVLGLYYYKSRPKEAFAESFARYFMKDSTFKKEWPNLYEFMRSYDGCRRGKHDPC